MLSNTISFVRDHLFTMPVLAKFAVGMVMLVIIPRLSRKRCFAATFRMMC